MKSDKRKNIFIGILSVVIVLLVVVIILLATKTVSFDFLFKSEDVTEGTSSKENVDDQDSNGDNKEENSTVNDNSSMINNNDQQLKNEEEDNTITQEELEKIVEDELYILYGKKSISEITNQQKLSMTLRKMDGGIGSIVKVV